MLPILRPRYSCLGHLLPQHHLEDTFHFRLVWAPVLWSCCQSEDLQRPVSHSSGPACETLYAKSPVVYCVLCGRVEIALFSHEPVCGWLSCGVDSSGERVVSPLRHCGKYA